MDNELTNFNESDCILNEEKKKEYDSELNQNYVKQSFDKLIYLYDNNEYQKYYLDEIMKSNKNIIHQNSNQYFHETQSSKVLSKKRLSNPKTKNKIKNNFKINELFCDSKCAEKFKIIYYNLIKNCSDKNKKLLEIINCIIEMKNDSNEIDKLYKFVKHET